MKLIGLVGGIASGKSFVAGVLRDLGAQIIDADQLAHQVLASSEVVSLIAERFGSHVCDEDGNLKRSELAKVVFGENDESRQALDWLEQQMHPRIHQLIVPKLQQWREEKIQAAVLDAPVLIKAGWHHQCDEIIFIECQLAVRQERAKRRGWDSSELLRREANQTPIDQKRSYATFVVQNDISEQETRAQLRSFWQQRIEHPAS